MTRKELLKVAKPILFNTEMVKAILEGRKTVTRRLVKPHPTKDMMHTLGFCVDGDKKDIGKLGFSSKECGGTILYVKPPCKPGDILYVRETWSEWTGGYTYRAWTGPFAQAGASTHMRWYPSIHMPKEAARIFLKVKDVRVERLQECGKGWCPDIEKEGVVTPQNPILYVSDDKYHDALREEFQKLWNSTIDKKQVDTYGWDANPYVWVIEFERIEVV